jgi:hypothetical protein
MYSLTGAPFDQITRIGDDSCGLSQRNIQNVKAGNYMLSNYRSDECGMKKPLDLATSQPNVFLNGGYHIGPGGCNIDDSSKLLIGNFPPKAKCRISLLQRPFATVPFLGRGESNPILESQIQQGDMITNKKSISTVTEQNFAPYKQYPLLPEISATINNAANLVEEVADNGWIRGGLPSREYARDKEYGQTHW